MRYIPFFCTPCPSPTPGVHSDSHPSSQWYHPAISSSVVPFSSCPQSLPASESFSNESTLCMRWPKYRSFGKPQIKSLTVSIVSPAICHEVMRPDAMIFVFWMLNFRPAFSFFHKRLFSYSLLSVIRVASSAYLRLLLFLLAILIPACASSSLAFHMMYCILVK